MEQSDTTHVTDRDCHQSQPPAMFGCGDGIDGKPLGARGDFGTGTALDIALGHRYSDRLRAEIMVTYRPNLDLSGQANFLGVAGAQPVRGDVRSLAVLGVGYLDLPELKAGPFQPFIGAGVGMTRNRLGATSYRFPSLGPNAATIARGGSHSDLAYLLTVGATLPLSHASSLDIAYRYADLGEVRGDDGPATIVRGSGTRVIDIAGTRADLKTHGISISLRHAF